MGGMSGLILLVFFVDRLSYRFVALKPCCLICFLVTALITRFTATNTM
jgi:hypothetical protein